MSEEEVSLFVISLGEDDIQIGPDLAKACQNSLRRLIATAGEINAMLELYEKGHSRQAEAMHRELVEGSTYAVLLMELLELPTTVRKVEPLHVFIGSGE